MPAKPIETRRLALPPYPTLSPVGALCPLCQPGVGQVLGGLVARRWWTVEQKRAIVEEYESSPHGSKGAVLRRHAISRRRVQDWMSYRDAGMLETGRRRGWQSRMTPRTESAEIGRLRREISRLEAELDKAQRDRWLAEDAAEALGKASALLQVMLESAESAPQSDPSSPAA